jgi:hypothetical protein
MIAIVVLAISICFVFLVYKNSTSKQLKLVNTAFGTSELILISFATSFLIYLTFFHYADYIRSLNVKVPHDRFIPPARAASYEFDGIEGYVLYSLMFVNIIVSFLIIRLTAHIKNKIIYFSLFLLFTIACVFYFVKIGFIPPMSNYDDYKAHNPFIMIVLWVVTGLLMLLYKNVNERIFLAVISVLLIPVCFIATEVLSIFDYSFILSPALRLVNGDSLSEIYFQYDLFLSLLAALWMKLNIDLNLFQLLGQLSFFILFIGVFIFSKRFFINKNYSVFILIITRYYGIMHEPVAILQVTPLRLELWFILLVLVYYKGAYHWINAVIIGLLLMVHKNFGLLYLLSYIQLVLTLFIVDFVTLLTQHKTEQTPLKDFFKNQLILNFKNILIIAGFVVASIILFKGFIPKSAILYQQIGVGMIQISLTSFYWYIPATFSICFVLLLKYRARLTVQYFQTALLIVFLAIGNSIYFFGRSHEHNILNIATSLALVLFLLFDLLGFSSTTVSETEQKTKAKKANGDGEENQTFTKAKRVILFSLPILCIAGSSYYYSDKVGHKLKTQYKNFKKSQYIYPLTIPTDFASLKNITNNSDSVYFLNYQDDFMYYFYGHYKPVGYFSPCATWVLKDDLLGFVQGLLDKNYYIVTTDLPRMAELLPELHYNKVAAEGAYTAFSKDSVELLLPETTTGAVVHLGMKSDLGKNGIMRPAINLNENFTIELLVKPGSEQVPNSNLMVNALTDSIGPSGMTFQQNGANTNQFLFAYGGGKAWTAPAMFMLKANEWNYIVVAVKNKSINVFNNGQMVASEKADFPIKNINVPLVIANGIGQNNAFNGLIREVKITNDTISEQGILQTLNMIKAKLN